jgi:enoyl-CoA hydratase/carnithine racemase
MLLHCDLVIAAEGARFQFPFVSLGLCPEAGSSVLLPQLAGHRVAAELLLLGEFIGADRARDAGIINEVVPPEALIPRAEAVTARLAAQPRDALLTTKALLRRPPGRLARDVIDEELPEFERLLLSDTARQTFQAFLSRRSPS